MPTKPPFPPEPAPSDPSRRRFLQVVGIGLATPSFLRLAACEDDTTKAKPITDGAAFFPQSIASGDPRPDSVVLWARVVDAAQSGDLDVTLLVGTDEALADPLMEVPLVASDEWDHVLKLKVSGLDPATRYYYRFVYEKGGERLGSRTGRTKTAPAATADVPIKLALASCQDFIGRYYHSYAKMLELVDELDMVLHVGDYIYETTGDPTFQAPGTEDRQVVFSDEAGAIPFLDATGKVIAYAAQSLSNYRELYRTYRSDKWLQAVHEKVPFVFIWDDHEFSDDCWQDSATYSDGMKREEHETARRAGAERANFEYLPTEHGLGTDGKQRTIGDKVPIKDAGTYIYKDLRFGRHVHLVLTDTRTYRPDHAIPEDAHFARVAIAKEDLAANGVDPDMLDAAGNPFYTPYADLAGEHAPYKAAVVAALVKVYQTALPDAGEADWQARAGEAAAGLFSAVEVNNLLKDEITAGTVTALDVSATTSLPRGATFDHLRFSKGKMFSANGLGARYLVEKRHYELYQKVRYAKDPKTQDVFGATQEAWLRSTIAGSDATWKVLTSSISTSAMIIDVSEEAFPPSLDNLPDTDNIRAGLQLFRSLLGSPYLLPVDQWDGFPQKRAELFEVLRATPGALVLSGDIHSFYMTDHGKGSGQNPIFEVTGGGISSESFKGFVRGAVDGLVPGISQSPTVGAVLRHLEAFLQETFPEMIYANNDAVGFATVKLGASQADVDVYVAPLEHVTTKAADQAAATAPFERVSFKIAGGVLSKV